MKWGTHTHTDMGPIIISGEALRTDERLCDVECHSFHTDHPTERSRKQQKNRRSSIYAEGHASLNSDIMPCVSPLHFTVCVCVCFCSWLLDGSSIGLTQPAVCCWRLRRRLHILLLLLHIVRTLYLAPSRACSIHWASYARFVILELWQPKQTNDGRVRKVNILMVDLTQWTP